jgi:hypothetical protein
MLFVGPRYLSLVGALLIAIALLLAEIVSHYDRKCMENVKRNAEAGRDRSTNVVHEKFILQ